ncbi:MAG: chorismate mutase, partial [Acidobacteriota bacterium]
MKRTGRRRSTPNRRVARRSVKSETPGDALDRLRRRIDDIDRRMVRFLNERASHAIEVVRVKKVVGLSIYQPSREDEVLRNVQSHNRGPLENSALRRLFERIIDESRSIERIVSASEGESAGSGARGNTDAGKD